MTSVVGEISRVYETNEITHKVAVLGTFSVIGAVLGPCFTFLFQYIDIAIGNWKWNIGNMIGIVMVGYYVFQFLLNYFTLFNVSKEFTLKKENLLNSNLDLSDMEEENENLLFKKETEKKKHFLYWQIYYHAKRFTKKQVHFVLAIDGYCYRLC